MGRLRTIALIVSVALHVGTAAGLVLLSETRLDQGGGDTPIEISLDPSAASGGNGPPIDAGPSEPPPQVAETQPQEAPPASEPPTTEDKPKAEQPANPETAPPPEDSKETPPTEAEQPPPVIRSAPDTDTPNIVASEPPPPPPPVLPKAVVPPKPVPPPQRAVAGGAAGGGPATGRVRTRQTGTAIDKGAENTCAAGVRARLRKPFGDPPHPFRVEIIVARSGTLLSAKLSPSSGSPRYDQAALSAVRNSGPFPPCPGIRATITIGIPFT